MMQRLLAPTIGLAVVLLAACGSDDTVVTLHGDERIAPTIETLGERFSEDESGVTVEVSLTDEADVLEMVDAGDGPDLYIDTAERVAALVEAGHGVGDPIDLGEDIPVIIVAEDNPHGVEGLDAFAPGTGLRAALCDPDSLCGSAAADLLEAAGVEPDEPTIVETDRDVGELVRDGDADLGIGYRTELRRFFATTSSVQLDDHGDHAIRYHLLALTEDGAESFPEWVLTEDDGWDILRNRGLRRFFEEAP